MSQKSVSRVALVIILLLSKATSTLADDFTSIHLGKITEIKPTTLVIEEMNGKKVSFDLRLVSDGATLTSYRTVAKITDVEVSSVFNVGDIVEVTTILREGKHLVDKIEVYGRSTARQATASHETAETARLAAAQNLNDDDLNIYVGTVTEIKPTTLVIKDKDGKKTHFDLRKVPDGATLTNYYNTVSNIIDVEVNDLVNVGDTVVVTTFLREGKQIVDNIKVYRTGGGCPEGPPCPEIPKKKPRDKKG